MVRIFRCVICALRGAVLEGHFFLLVTDLANQFHKLFAICVLHQCIELCCAYCYEYLCGGWRIHLSKGV